ncbi:cytochrome P450 monooxygenase [Mycena amicta]|nr:cytochrome P450 monooxygenase [Mycena amicta]
MSQSLVIAGSLFALIVWLAFRSKRTQSRALPPGPPRELFIGNLRQMPADNAGEVFHGWAKTYGDVMHLSVPGRPAMIILDSLEAAEDLLEKRSLIYSDRPHFPLYNMFWDGATSLLPYGKRLTKHRQMHNVYLSHRQCESAEYKEMQLAEARDLARNFLDSPPEQYESCLGRFATGIITQILVGHQIVSDEDDFLCISLMIQEAVSRSGPPGGTIIDLLPFLRYFPRWLPGMQPARMADQFRPIVVELHDLLLRTVRERRASGEASPSYVLTFLEEMESESQSGLSPEDEEDLKTSAATMFAAGQSTTWGTLSTFILIMLLHPECQQRAHEELDRVVGKGVLPTFHDRESLPYLQCIYQEVFRWSPSTPLGVPHRLSEEDVYRGMRIPAGSTVIANIRGMTLDENIYTEPNKFLPERYLPVPHGYGEPHFPANFGFGRRICTGQHLAENSVWIAMATILASCEIDYALDANGQRIVPLGGMSDGVASHPNPYQCVIRPRMEL